MKRYQRSLTDKVLDRTLQVVITALMLSVIGAAMQIKPINDYTVIVKE